MKSERTIVFLVGAVQFVNILDFMIVMPLGPDFAVGLDIPISKLGYIGGSSGGAVRDTFTEDDDPKRLIELEQMLTKAADLQRRGQIDEAVTLYQQVIARRPDTEDAYRKLALVYWRSGRPRDAVATLESALAAGVTQSEVRIKLAQYLAQSGQPVRARRLPSSRLTWISVGTRST